MRPPCVSMKKGPMSTAGWIRELARIDGVGVRSRLYRSCVRWLWSRCSRAQFLGGPSGGQTQLGASGSKGLVPRQHVPDRAAELPGDDDPRDLAATVFAE